MTAGPNLLVVVLDAVRAWNLSCYGHERPTTPAIDRLAERSMVFETATAPASNTWDSSISLFSSEYPTTVPVTARGIDPSVPLISDRLSESGYTTAVSTATPFLGDDLFFNGRIDRYYSTHQASRKGLDVRQFFRKHRKQSKWRRYAAFGRRIAGPRLPWHLLNALKLKYTTRIEDDSGAGTVVPKAEEFIRDTEEPWFVYTHLLEAHTRKYGPVPYTAPEEDLYRFLDERPSQEILDQLDGAITSKSPGEEAIDGRERLYDGAIRYLDRQVERLLETLDECGGREDTIVVVAADHGEHFGEHGLVGHGPLYEPNVHVPLIVSVPEGPAERVEERTSTRSVLKSIVDGCITGEVPDPATLRTPPEVVVAQDHSVDRDWASGVMMGRARSAVYRDGWKLIDNIEDRELFRLSQDLDESVNLVGDHPEQVADLEHHIPETVATATDREVPEFDESARQRLEDLGYI